MLFRLITWTPSGLNRHATTVRATRALRPGPRTFQIRGRKLQKKPVILGWALGCHAGCAVITSPRQCPPQRLLPPNPLLPNTTPQITTNCFLSPKSSSTADNGRFPPKPSTRAKCSGSARGRAAVAASQHCFIIIFHTRVSPWPGPSALPASLFHC